jgi:hypothetical protein
LREFWVPTESDSRGIDAGSCVLTTPDAWHRGFPRGESGPGLGSTLAPGGRVKDGCLQSDRGKYRSSFLSTTPVCTEAKSSPDVADGLTPQPVFSLIVRSQRHFFKKTIFSMFEPLSKQTRLLFPYSLSYTRLQPHFGMRRTSQAAWAHHSRSQRHFWKNRVSLFTLKHLSNLTRLLFSYSLSYTRLQPHFGMRRTTQRTWATHNRSQRHFWKNQIAPLLSIFQS